MAGSDWASAPVTCHSSERRFALWQLLLRVGIGTVTQSYNGMPDLATWTPTRRSHRAASRSQARACRRSSCSMTRPRLAQCDSVLQPRVGPKRRLVFERPRNGERATLWVDKHRVLQAQGGVDPIAKTAITRRCVVCGCFWGPWVRYTPGGQNRLPQRSHWSARWRASRWAVKVT